MRNEEERKLIGEKIRYYRRLSNMSQEELARKIGYTTENCRSTINKMEQGKSDIPASRLKLIASALGVDVTSFFDFSSTTIHDNHGVIGNGNNNIIFGADLGELEKEILSVMSKMSTKQKNALLTKAYEIAENVL
ncbi:MAG: helix-turn-helix transcriptional regulator [Clostridia bacterium]|nr:helix-turn-helix transcriptional regulator [Clostridia bacterium]